MSMKVEEKYSLQNDLKKELSQFLNEQENKYPKDEILKIDLHCHDHNSDVPDELLGRILNVPETWLPTEDLVNTLKKNGSDVITITNHNNARSCFELIDQDQDVLVGAEFTVLVPDFNTSIHVLTYGFTKSQEIKLNKLRRDLYQFLKYAKENDIPTIWAHPLYYYKSEGAPSLDFFNKMALVFERFEVINGQRDTWQNMLVKVWIENLTEDRIDQDAAKYGVRLEDFCHNPYRKCLSGGSDSHMGIFSGQTGTFLHIANLQNRLKTSSKSELALEAIRSGNMAPFGTHQNLEKLTIAFLDYVFQIAINKKDPGLMRILLHKGNAREKLVALSVSNAFSELQHHKITMRFVELFHKCFVGKVPTKLKRLLIPKDYKPVFDDALKIAKAHELDNTNMVKEFYDAINSISYKLNTVLFNRLTTKINKLISSNEFSDIKLDDFIEKLEIPSDIRSLFSKDIKGKKNNSKSPNAIDFLDGLSFPFLASSIVLGANFMSSKVLFNNRPILQEFSEHIGHFKHPKRMLWLTDTFHDKNGVSMVLQQMLKEIKNKNLPIDIMVCSDEIESEDHLIVVKPLSKITLPFYDQQPIRVPNFNQIHSLFLENEYDRIMCSTEGVMGLAALFLKNAYHVPTHFYIHTDWIMFSKKILKLNRHNISRVRRSLRAYYGAFDKLFVLNTDHQKWLTSDEMGFKSENIHLTAHWVDEKFTPKVPSKNKLFKLSEDDNILLFAGRLSHEKGVMDIVDIYPELIANIPKLKIVFAGTGPAESQLKEALPDALFMGWVPNNELPNIYSSADLLILPSKFDTFSCVVLESISCGTPVITYNTKGPKNILIHNKCGFLASNKHQLAEHTITYFNNLEMQNNFRIAALERSKDYKKQSIMEQFLKDIELEKQPSMSFAL